MTIYVVTRKADDEVVYTYSADAPVEWHGFEFAAHDHTPLPAPEEPGPTPVFGGRRRLTKLEFAGLLGDVAFAGIPAAQQASLEVSVWVKLLDLATPDPDGTSVDLDDPRVEAGLAAMEAAEVLSAGTTVRVLYG